MSLLQIVLLPLAIFATLYEIVMVGEISALLGRFGRVRILPDFYLCMAIAVAVQALFVLSLTGNIG